MRAMTAKAARNRRSKTSVSLTLAAVATHATGTPSPSTATWYFVPRLALSVRLGPVRSPARLARTEQLSRIRSGWPRSMPTSTAWTCASRPIWAQRVSHRRGAEPPAGAAAAVRLRQGVPPRRNRRNVASTRIVSAGGWPRAPSRGGSQNSITVAIRRKILTSKAALHVWPARHGHPHQGPLRQTTINGGCENRLLGWFALSIPKVNHTLCDQHVFQPASRSWWHYGCVRHLLETKTKLNLNLQTSLSIA